MEGEQGWWRKGTPLLGEGEGRGKQANLDKRRISNSKLGPFMGGSHLVGTEVDCRQQVLWRRCYDGPEAVHLHCAHNC